jgi:hypothetical protein
MTDRKKKPVLVQFTKQSTKQIPDGASYVWYDEGQTHNSTAAAEKWLQDNASEGYTYRIVTVERDNLALAVETKRRLSNAN